MNAVNKEQRLEECKTCEYYWSRLDHAIAVCKKCGCMLAWKIALEKGKCPVGKW